MFLLLSFLVSKLFPELHTSCAISLDISHTELTNFELPLHVFRVSVNRILSVTVLQAVYSQEMQKHPQEL